MEWTEQVVVWGSRARVGLCWGRTSQVGLEGPDRPLVSLGCIPLNSSLYPQGLLTWDMRVAAPGLPAAP